MILTALAALALLPSVPTSAVASPSASTEASASVGVFDALAYFYVPSEFVNADFKVCATRFRAIMVSSSFTAVEKDLPGLIDRMVQAAAELCGRELPAAMQRVRDKVRADWATTNPGDLALIGAIFIPYAETTLKIDADAAKGVDVSAASTARDAVIERAFDDARSAQGGTALANRLLAYQVSINAVIKINFDAVIKASIAAGNRAANDFAKARGHAPLYPDEPAA